MILYFLFQVYISTILAFILGAMFGSLSNVALISLIVGFVLAIKPAKEFSKAYPDLRFSAFSPGGRGLMEIALSVVALYVGVRHFMWLLYPADHNWNSLSLFNFGDLPLHIDYIRYMASGAHFPPVNPSFASESLRYPLGIDLYNALWEQLHIVPLRSHLFLVGVISIIASVVLLRGYSGWLGIGAVFLSGGLAGWSLLQGKPLVNPLDAIEWKNLFLAVFLPQRGFLIALPVGLLLLLVTRRHFSGERLLNRSQAIWMGVLWGFLPLFHLHTFVIVSVLMAASALELQGLKGLRRFFTSTPFYVAFVPALLLVLRSTSGFAKADIAHWKLWWGAPEGKVLEFFVVNFGPWLLLPVAIAVALAYGYKRWPRQVWRERAIEFAVLLGLFVFFLNYMLAPWAWDNIKILIWPYLGFVRLAYVIFDPMLRPALRPAVAVPLFLSGFISLIWSIQSPAMRGVRIYSFEDLANAEGALKGVGKDAIFAAAPTHDHVLTYFGRARVLGYEGHLWSHGINSQTVTSLQTKLMAGDPDWLKLAKDLGITHIYWGPVERMQYGVGDRPWMKVLKNVSDVPDHQIYAVTGEPQPGESQKEK